VYWCEKCKPERYEKEEKVEVTEHQDGTIRANGIQIVPSPRIDWCGACKSEHGYDCPLDTPQTPSWEDKVDYFFKFQSVNHYPEDKNKLIEELELTINSLISQTKQEGRREGIEEAILEIIYGCARYTNMHQDTDDVNVAVNTVRADVLSKLDKKRK
jgi:hypothetical protein